MPKIVDHERRRQEIVEATWEFIARQGFDKLNLRDLAASTGYTNGALKPYFPTRDSILVATFEYVFGATEVRIAKVTRGLEGTAAIRAFAQQVLPLDAKLRDEARVIIHFWHVALQDESMARLYVHSMDGWRRKLDLWLAQVPELTSSRIAIARDALLTYLLGAQTTATLDQESQTPRELADQLEYLLESLH